MTLNWFGVWMVAFAGYLVLRTVEALIRAGMWKVFGEE